MKGFVFMAAVAVFVFSLVKHNENALAGAKTVCQSFSFGTSKQDVSNKLAEIDASYMLDEKNNKISVKFSSYTAHYNCDFRFVKNKLVDKRLLRFKSKDDYDNAKELPLDNPTAGLR